LEGVFCILVNEWRILIFFCGWDSIRQDARAALLASKRTIDSQSKSQRDELFASSAVSEKRNENEKVTSVRTLFRSFICAHEVMLQGRRAHENQRRRDRRSPAHHRANAKRARTLRPIGPDAR
jgi:hypothetical protein